jgi:predicted ABC-type sugar transport system permease subunit
LLSTSTASKITTALTIIWCLAGGKGRIVGTLIGALILGFLNNGLNLLGVSSYPVEFSVTAFCYLPVPPAKSPPL